MGSAFIDQLDHTIRLVAPPTRIISVVPSQTELLHDLGLENEVVGITRFCVHPRSWFETKAKVGGTKDFRFEAIDALQPDLIIGNKEENYREGIEKLREKYPVWMSDIVTLEDALRMIASVGEIVGREAKAGEIVQKIKEGFKDLSAWKPARVLYLIWRNPWMGVGKLTFVNSILEKLGLANVVMGERYPVFTDKEIAGLSPDIIFLSSEPFPFRDKHKLELAALVPGAKIMFVDGEMFSWYGSRLVESAGYFEESKVISEKLAPTIVGVKSLPRR